ncbi:MAG TPA: cupin domain-containing protein [Acidimicrobiales bacterium]|nr:cupin domain-containing protein [Acidimicrobiales bacterium]
MTTSARRAVVATWDSIPFEQVRRGVTRRAFGTEDVILVLNEIAPEMDPAPHTHEGFDQIALILSGRARYHIAGVGHEVGPGSLLLIPAGEEHYIEPAGAEPVQNLDVFAPARSDYRHLLAWMAGASAPASPGGGG